MRGLKKHLLLAAACLAFSFGQGSGSAAPLSLDESVRLALATHEDMAAVKAARDSARWGLSAVRRTTGLNFQWQSEALRLGGRSYEESGSEQDPYNNTFSNYFSLRIPLYTGGKLENQINAEKQGLFAADLTTEGTRQTIRYRALGAYYNLLQRANLWKVSKSAVDMATGQRDLIKVHVEEGAAAYADLLQMEVQLANYRQGLVSAQGNLDAARYSLARIVGWPQDTPIEPTDDFTYVPFTMTLAECEAYALAHRPDGVAAEFRVRQAEASKNAQKGDWQPTVQAIATKNLADNKAFSKSRTETWAFGLQLSWSVFDNGVTSAKVNTAKEQEEQARAQAEKLRHDILLETRSAYAEMKAAEKNIQSTNRAVKKAEDSLMIAEARYNEGVDILLTVTKAQEKLNQARSNHYIALYQYNVGRAALEKAIGVPVALNVPRYQEVVDEGKSATEALKQAAVPASGADKQETQDKQETKKAQSKQDTQETEPGHDG